MQCCRNTQCVHTYVRVHSVTYWGDAQGRGFHMLGHHLASGLVDSSSRSP